MSVQAGILIGGRSKRMGSPKHLLEMNGLSFAARLIRAVEPCVETTHFLGRGNLPPGLSNYPQHADAPDIQGPLAGILGALHAHHSPWLIVACDLPLLTSTACRWLLNQRQAGISVIIPRDSQGKVQPHFSFFEAEALSLIEKAIAEGIVAPRDLVQLPSCASPMLPATLEVELTNVNDSNALNSLNGTS